MLGRGGRLLLLAGAALLLLGIAVRTGAALYTESAWYAAAGYGRLFWARLFIAGAVRLLAAVLAAGVVLANLWIVTRQLGPIHVRRRYGNLEIAEQVPRSVIHGGVIAVSLLTGWWLAAAAFGGGQALELAAWLRTEPWGTADPLFGRDLSFYVLALPALFRAVDFAGLIVVWTLLLALLGYVLVSSIRWRANRLEVDPQPWTHLGVLLASLLVIIAVRVWLGGYALLIDGAGFGGGTGFTDVHARLPVRRVLGFLTLGAAVVALVATRRRRWAPAATAIGALLVVSLLAGRGYPAFVQRFRVEPNEFSREAEYIAWNIRFTRLAYGVDGAARHAFRYVPGVRPSGSSIRETLPGLPLWDPEPLQVALNQIQAIYGYYHFPDVDYDRYPLPGGGQAQVAIGIREFNRGGLPENAATWQTLHLNQKYIGGSGAVVVPASEPSVEGEPVLWLGNLDPVTRSARAPEQLQLRHERILFGESLTPAAGAQQYVIWTGAAFDSARVAPDTAAAASLDSLAFLPGARRSATATADTAPAPLAPPVGSLLGRLAYALRFRDVNLLFSREVRADSRVLFRRGLHERVTAIAPFLFWDGDAYPVIAEGRVQWVLDGYSASATYPLSRPVDLRPGLRVRYLRGAAKAVVDAVTGETVVYAVDDAEPLLNAYGRVFQGLVRPTAEMPAWLVQHQRYPTLLLSAQARILEEYHVENPAAFYAGQDVWAVPHDPSDASVGSYRPTYMVARVPGADGHAFVLVLPFIAKQRQNMTALFVAHNDPGRYGDLALLELPRDQQIPGPAQVQATIEQDPVISPQLSLWRQSGSDVNLGSLRVLPTDSAFLYVQPLFLSAGERANPIPELRRVILSDGRNVAMAESVLGALDQLSGTVTVPAATARAAPRAPEQVVPADASERASRRALELLEQAERRAREGDWAGFGESLEELRRLLQEQAKEDI